MRRTSRFHWHLLPLIMFVVAQPAAACIGPAPPLRLPDETDAAFKLRSESVFAAESDEQRRAWQQDLHDRADRVFIAMVTESRELAPTGGEPERRMTVRPMHALKGDLPRTRVEIRDMRRKSCQVEVGGIRRIAERGDYTIVFHGIRWNQARLESIMEVAVHEARDPRLIRALFDWGVAEARRRGTAPR